MDIEKYFKNRYVFNYSKNFINQINILYKNNILDKNDLAEISNSLINERKFGNYKKYESLTNLLIDSTFGNKKLRNFQKIAKEGNIKDFFNEKIRENENNKKNERKLIYVVNKSSDNQNNKQQFIQRNKHQDFINNILLKNVPNEYKKLYIRMFYNLKENSLNKKLNADVLKIYQQLILHDNPNFIKLLVDNNISDEKSIISLIKINNINKDSLHYFITTGYNPEQLEMFAQCINDNVSLDYLKNNFDKNIDISDIKNLLEHFKNQTISKPIDNFEKNKITLNLLRQNDFIQLPQKYQAIFRKANNLNDLNSNRSILSVLYTSYMDDTIDKLLNYMKSNKSISGFRLEEIRAGLKDGQTKEQIDSYAFLSKSSDMQKMRRVFQVAKTLSEEGQNYINLYFKDFKSGLYSVQDFISLSDGVIIGEKGTDYSVELLRYIDFNESIDNNHLSAALQEALHKNNEDEVSLLKRAKSYRQFLKIQSGIEMGLPLKLVNLYVGYNAEKMEEIKMAIIGLNNLLLKNGKTQKEATDEICSTIYLIANNNLSKDEMQQIRYDYAMHMSEIDIQTKYNEILKHANYRENKTYINTKNRDFELNFSK